MSKTKRRTSRLDVLEARITGPKRVALFGHRNVGKTTLLAMFYREASSGRVPSLRMAESNDVAASRLKPIRATKPMVR